MQIGTIITATLAVLKVSKQIELCWGDVFIPLIIQSVANLFINLLKKTDFFKK